MKVFARDKVSRDMGMSGYVLVTAWGFYRKLPGGGYDQSAVAVRSVDKAIEHYAGKLDDGVPVVLDIEAFDPFEDFDHAVAQFKKALRRWKSAQPDRPIGIYRYLPAVDIWGPLGVSGYRGIKRFPAWRARKERVNRWKEHNDRMADALLPLVDFLVPHVYYYKAGWLREWMEYVDANLDEAGRVSRGKPVYPILMTEHTSPRSAIATEDWEDMLGLISHHPATGGLMIHDEDADWDWRTPLLQVKDEVSP